MGYGEVFTAAYRTYVARASDILPFYFFGIAVSAIAQSVPILVGMIGLVYLWSTGRLTEIQEALEDVGPISIDEPSEAAVDEFSEVQEAIQEAIGLSVAELGIIGILVGVVTLIAIGIMQAAVSAGQIHAAFAATENRLGVSAGVSGVFQHTKTFVGLLLGEVFAHIAVLGVIGTIIATLALVSPGLAVVVGVLSMLVWLLLAAVIRLFFAFAPVVAVVENTGFSGAVRQTGEYMRKYPGDFLGYTLMTIAIIVAGGITVGLFSQIGAGSVGLIVYGLIIFPILDLLKVLLYGRTAESTTFVIVKDFVISPVKRIQMGLKRGWEELMLFTREQISLVVISALIFGVALQAGVSLGTVFSTALEASIEQRIEEMSPVGSFFEFAANNWSVAVALSFGGVVLAIPAVLTLAFNGLFIGVLYELDADPDLLLAFVIPHGLLEIPGLLLAGATGLYVGLTCWRYIRGRADRDSLEEMVHRTYLILIGLIIVFVAAAAIEAFISPYYWRLF
ncbi:stage II sporulation protein M [Salinarchaeum sp. IM2453]|uniref:stage II sporulation protein M n=1 Tax=Salinarchaeum sp. IM2453 TaxID=2862870 RepID=UPI001C82CA77|nr:stage II sporulation protein M [Salinarchaeum sp. IM2453]QZA89450.1 stage II sporulation protein M [Salinarchaeum sp. IM2453]